MATKIKSAQILDGAIVAADLHSAIAINTTQSGTFGTLNSNGLLTVVGGDILINDGSNDNERSVRLQNSSVTALLGIEGSSANRFIGSTANNMFLGTTTADGIQFATNNTVRATIDSSGDAVFSGDLTVTGDLTVEGAQVSLNTTALDVEDKNITLNYHASNDTSASADGAGITIQDAVNSTTDATILWDATNDKFDFSHSIAVTNTNPVLTLQDTDATNTYNRTEFQNSGGGLNLNTRHSDGTFVSTDYQIGKNATGAVEHKWFIGATARSRITSSGDAEWYEDNSGSPQVGMHWDYADGYLGIGTDTPSDRLEVLRTSTDQTVGLTLTNTQAGGYGSGIVWKSKRGDAPNDILDAAKIVVTGANSWGSDNNTASQMQFWTQKDNTLTKHMTLSKNGNLGIGTDSPNAPLEVHGSDIATGATTTASSVLRLVRDVVDPSHTLRKDSAVDFMLSRQQAVANNLPYTRLDIRLAGTTDTSTPSLDVMSLLHNGNVGIGTTSPSATVHADASGGGVVRVTRLSSSTSAYGQLEHDGASTTLRSTGELKLYADTNIRSRASIHTFANVAGTTEYGRFDSSGKLIIGTSTTNYTKAKLTILANPGDPATTGTSTTNVGLRLATNSSNSQAMDLGIYNDSPYGGWIQASNSGGMNNHSPISINPNGGNVGVGTNDPASKLHISGNSDIGDEDCMLIIEDVDGSVGSRIPAIVFRSNTGGTVTNQARIRGTDTQGIVMSGSATLDDDLVVQAGGVGIGTTSPAHKLDVVGAIATRQVRHNILPTLNIDFANSKELDSRIVFYRDSVATYYDSSGTLRYANVNEPRLDHNPYTGESKGLLIEEARTPILGYGEHLPIALGTEFSAYWKANYAVAPNGKMQAAALFGGGNTSARAATGYTGAGTYTMSIYAKNNASNATGRFGIWAYSGGWVYAVTFTWDGDTVTHNAPAGSTIVEKIGNGWVRVTATWTTTGNGSFQISPGAYANYNAGDSTLFWGLNFQRNETCSTSYIPSNTKFVSRASAATYYNETGTLTTAPRHTARHGYTYDGRNWVETGLILETASTNMLYHSTKGSDLYGDLLAAEALWTMTDSSTDVTAPDGSSKTTKGVSGTSGNSWYWQVSPFSYTNGNTYTHSAWIRCAAGTTGTISLNVYPQTGAINVTATDEWQRVSVTFTYNSSVANPYIGFVSPQHSRTFYFWGWQIEEQSQPTSYIKTLGSAVTRTADISTSDVYTRAQDFAHIDDLSWYNSKESTIYGEGTSITGDSNMGGSGCLWGITDGTSDNRYLLRRNSSGGTATYSGYTFRVCAPGIDTYRNNDYFPLNTVLPFWQDTEIHKMALSIKPNSQIGAADGIDAEMPSITMPEFDAVTMAQIGFAGSSAAWNGHIRKISYYPEQLTLTELKALTEAN